VRVLAVGVLLGGRLRLHVLLLVPAGGRLGAADRWCAVSICFCASGCGCSGYAEGPFHLRGSCSCFCHDDRCGCPLHRGRREARAEQNPVSPELLDELADVLALHGVDLDDDQRAALDADLSGLGVFAAEFAQAVASGLRARLEEPRTG
jgi:hypothetical protein